MFVQGVRVLRDEMTAAIVLSTMEMGWRRNQGILLFGCRHGCSHIVWTMGVKTERFRRLNVFEFGAVANGLFKCGKVYTVGGGCLGRCLLVYRVRIIFFKFKTCENGLRLLALLQLL